ncbi:post-GPI attachment to proteins factor 6-like isoform X1 [Polypterus senegalus]|uniref:post-GPI attachment to proteins factor 6-like isoform X1 n=1 Tax=Polypterus senegalus TaxID=55291 RepID=UPI0019650E4D|nr:post-GPI attachment to proteins factor 6-like isoform X1 [Polypterus senegalus]
MKDRIISGLIFTVFITNCAANDLTYVSEYSSVVPQKLDFYSWYGNVRLALFKVPEDTVLVRWLLTVSQRGDSDCGNTNITIHIRAGAPPVINPLQTEFPTHTAFVIAYNLTLTLNSNGQNLTFLNLTNPVAGDWFMAAHLPKHDGKIEQKGFSSQCLYLFQSQMFVRKVIDIPILVPGVAVQNAVSSSDRPALFKIYIPDYTVDLSVQLTNCTQWTAGGCPVLLTVGSATLLPGSTKTLNCSWSTNCTADLQFLPWQNWVRVTVESINANMPVSFQIKADLTVGCKPHTAGLFGGFFTNFNGNNTNQSAVNVNTSLPVDNLTLLNDTNKVKLDNKTINTILPTTCLLSQSMFREDLDVVSARFAVITKPNFTISSITPALFSLNLNRIADSGGTLTLELRLNKTSLTNENSTIVACLNARSPIMTNNGTETCSTAFSQGYSIKLNITSPEATLYIPFPESAWWYLSILLVCPENISECGEVSGTALAAAELRACINDCGTYGECRMLRSYGYLYAACVCKAGWGGWSCTDETTAQSYGRQLLAALLLTLSNLLFIPLIVVAVYRHFIVEASVYTFTMFFSTFYHACDQPGITVMCIMEYDTLQYCDFLGSVSSIWVTILCMARVKDILKYMLFMLGCLIIAMSMQLDRRGLWNMLGPSLFALITMIAAWTYRGVKRRHCYPSSWKRWVFFLIPGLGTAIIGLCVYVFAETDDNYYYTHSIWHIMVATSAAFLLPPRDKHRKPWGLSQRFFCRYQICNNEREELYTVT